jgi:hypothetical protein
MNTIFQIAVILIAAYVLVEVGTAIYIYRNRDWAIPRIRYNLRNILGLDRDLAISIDNERHVNAKLEKLERKINYIGNHTKFERDQLRRMGILRDDTADGQQPTSSKALRN